MITLVSQAPSYSQKDGEIPELLGQAGVSGLRS